MQCLFKKKKCKKLYFSVGPSILPTSHRDLVVVLSVNDNILALSREQYLLSAGQSLFCWLELSRIISNTCVKIRITKLILPIILFLSQARKTKDCNFWTSP